MHTLLERPLAAHLAVAGAGLLFGSSFLVVRHAVLDARPTPFLAVRFCIGALALAPLAHRRPRSANRSVLRDGGACGGLLLIGYLFQTVGLTTTTSSVSAFVTYLLVPIVPVLSAAVLRRPPGRAAVAGVVLATVGLALLTGRGAGFHRGEALTLGCAFAFAAHIVVLARVAPDHDALRLTAVQLAVVGVACLIPGAFLGGYRLDRSVWLAALYTGVAVSALGFVLQVWGQRQVGPTRTSLLLLVEPLAAAALGALAGDHLGGAGLAGAALILAGILVAELPIRRRLLTERSREAMLDHT